MCVDGGQHFFVLAAFLGFVRVLDDGDSFRFFRDRSLGCSEQRFRNVVPITFVFSVPSKLENSHSLAIKADNQKPRI